MTERAIGKYLLSRLYGYGIRHMFGVPGDYILRFYDLLAHDPIQHIGTTREDTAAFAADGYARSHGLGAVAVTYGVGALNIVNAVAGAYSESSPVVVICGAPGVKEQHERPMLHHRFGPFHFQREIFERITCAAVVLDDPFTALREIDRTLDAAKQHSKPVYIELPRDMTDIEAFSLPHEKCVSPCSNQETLQEAVTETLRYINTANKPMVLAGVELHRRGLQNLLSDFIKRSCLPIAATLTGKSVFAERHPAYLGVYEGAMGSQQAREAIETADFLLILGAVANDVDTGIFTTHIQANCLVRAAENEVYIHHHCYPQVCLPDYLADLSTGVQEKHCQWPQQAASQRVPVAQKNRLMTIKRLIACLNQVLTPSMSIVVDVGDCLFSALELRVHDHSQFLASAFYSPMGFAIPAALGLQMADSDQRPIILVGDGAFQMTGTELSTTARFGLNPIVIVLNNKGYSTERFILEGSFNDIASWNFHQLGKLFGPLQGFDAADEESFDLALAQALLIQDQPSIINVHLRKDDVSTAMLNLAAHVSKNMAG